MSRFRATDGAPEAALGSDGPRLGIALLVRAAPPCVLDGFLRYHLGIGFERIFIYFDAPHEDVEALKVAEDCAQATGAVTISRCTAAWWAELDASKRSRFLARGRAPRQQRRRAGRALGVGVVAGENHPLRGVPSERRLSASNH